MSCMAENVTDTRPVVVLGGTGRVGAAVVDELTAGGQEVVVVSRRPPRHDRPLVEYRAGDVQSLAAVLSGVDARAAVIAVTPFTEPPSTFDGFDRDFFTRIVEQLAMILPAGSRVVDVAVTAIARLSDGSVVADHEELFPGWLRPFSDAHARGADQLLTTSTLDGMVLIPAAGLGLHGTRSQAQPVMTPEPVTIEVATAAVDHAVLARAVVDALAEGGPARRLVVHSGR